MLATAPPRVRQRRDAALFPNYFGQTCLTSASARSISRHMAPVDANNLAIPGAISHKMGEDLSEMWPNRKMGEDLSEMWPNRHVKYHTDR